MTLRSFRIAAIAALLALPAMAQQFPNQARGFAPGKPFQANGIDNINIFNGNLTVDIPIGQTYRVNGALSYGFSLVYSGNVWDVITTITPPLTTTIVPNRRSNAGMGWLFSLGRVIPPWDPTNESSLGPVADRTWVYESPDGHDHVLYPTLHGTSAETNDGIHAYSRDSTYIRMTMVDTTTRNVEFGDGTQQVFRELDPTAGDVVWPVTASPGSGVWKLVDMHDRFGNTVTIEYRTDATYPEKWRVSDGLRTHNVYFKTAAAPYTVVLDHVDLATFNGSASWTIGTTPFSVARGPGDTSANGSSGGPYTVPLLTSVTLPAIGSISETYSALLNGLPDYDTTGTTTGHLRGLQLPTRGWLEWDYVYGSLSGGPSFKLRDKACIVISRRTLSKDRVTTATWTYQHRLSTSNSCVGIISPPSQLVAAITTPEGSTSVHYFSVYKDAVDTSCPDDVGNPAEYSLPISPSVALASDGRNLSEEVRTGTVNLTTGPSNYRVTGGSVQRTEYAKYQYDPDGELRNTRVTSTATVYDDDNDPSCGGVCRSTTSFLDFDNFGHFRQTSTGGNFAAGNFRTSFTKYPVLAQTGAWLLNTFSESCTVEDNQERTTAATQCADLASPPSPPPPGWVIFSGPFVNHYCFDSNGFLTRQRRLFGSAAGLVDTVAVFTQSAGNINREDFYGGDGASLGSPLCSMALPSPTYSIVHTYSNGALATTAYVATTAHPNDPGFLIIDNTINQNTGLVSKSRDTASRETSYDYDALGRMIQVSPPGEAPVTYTYTTASAAGPAQLRVQQVSSTAGTVESTTIFDDLGRTSEERRVMPAATAKRQTLYTGSGWTERVSAWEATPTHFTVFSSFDAFGRPGKITAPPPDSSETTFAYKGAREVKRTVNVGTQLSGGTVLQTAQTTTQTFDRLGRLTTVAEPNGATTLYEYDAANRLRKVTIGAQTPRTFAYDGRGFLTQEVHPENGTTNYTEYDARGHIGKKLLGNTLTDYDLKYEYDAAERLAKVNQLLNRTTDQTRLLKEFTFATSNVGTNYQQGKLLTAKRENYSPLGTIEVAETYTYDDTGGRLTSKTTSVNAPSGLLQKFSQSYTYNDLGLRAGTTYPSCPDNSRPCAGSTLTVTPTFTNGLLKSVPNYATNITYGLNGLTSQITHDGTVPITDTITPDSSGIPRPSQIKFETYNPCTQPGIAQQPQDAQFTGSAVTLSVTATSGTTTPVTFQWLKDGVIIQNEVNSSLVIASLTATARYKARITNSCGMAESREAVVAVCGNPTIQQQPQDAAYSGAAVTLTVVAAGCAPLSYQWYIGASGTTTNPTGTNSSSLTISSLTSTTRYWVHVTDSTNGPVNSTAATVTVSTPFSQPGTLTATLTGSAQITVSWGASAGAQNYEVERLTAGQTTPVCVSGTFFVDDNRLPNTTYAYRVRAQDQCTGGRLSPYSNRELATTITFNLIGTTRQVFLADFDQVLSAINMVRAAAGAGPLTWRLTLDNAGYTMTPIPASGALIRTQHLLALRAAMDAALQALTISASAYTDSLSTPTPIRAVHITQLQQRAQ